MVRPATQLVIVVALVLLGACAAPRRPVPEPSRSGGDRGGVWLYADLADLPDDLRFRVAAVTVESEDGVRRPLTPAAASSGTLSRSTDARLVATGALPDGQYTAIHVAMRDVTVARADMEVASAVPERAIRLAVPFSLRRGRIALLRFGPRGGESPDGSAFPVGLAAWTVNLPAVGRLEVVVQDDPPALVLLDRLSGEVAGAIPGPGRIAAAALDVNRRRVYVASPDTDEVIAFSVPEGERAARGWTAAGDEPCDLALDPSGSTLVVGYCGSASVGIWDAERLLERGRAPAGDSLASIRLSPSGQEAFAFDPLGNAVFRVDVERASLSGAVQVEAEPFLGRYDEQGRRLYVLRHRSPDVAVLDTAAPRVEETVFVGHDASALAVDPESGRILFAVPGSRSVEVFEPNGLLPVDTLVLDLRIRDLRVDPQTGYLWVVPDEGRTVWLYDRRATAPRRAVELPGRPLRLSTTEPP
jgi:DNA-binding beta-propeller fold protein YncE